MEISAKKSWVHIPQTYVYQERKRRERQTDRYDRRQNCPLKIKSVVVVVYSGVGIGRFCECLISSQTPSFLIWPTVIPWPLRIGHCWSLRIQISLRDWPHVHRMNETDEDKLLTLMTLGIGPSRSYAKVLITAILLTQIFALRIVSFSRLVFSKIPDLPVSGFQSCIPTLDFTSKSRNSGYKINILYIYWYLAFQLKENKTKSWEGRKRNLILNLAIIVLS